MTLPAKERDPAVSREWLPRALLLDPSALPGGACWADARVLDLAEVPILLGWRRGGGLVVTGAAEGEATLELFVAVRRFAKSATGWSEERCDAAFREFWSRAARPLREALEARLPLPPPEDWSLESWAVAVWGTFTGAVEPPAMVVVGTSVSDAVVDAVLSGVGPGRTAAFTVSPLDESRSRVRCSLVVGELDPSADRALPGVLEAPVAGDYRPDRERGPAQLIGAIERIAGESGAVSRWFRKDWVRIEGSGGAIRVFPRGEGAWLQLAGIDEGTLAGLRYRHGIALDMPAQADAPPGAHLFLPNADAFTPQVEAVVRRWLRGHD